jgi:SLOG family YspA-like protein
MADNLIKRLKVELKANVLSDTESDDTIDTLSSDEGDDDHHKMTILAIVGSRTMVDQDLFDVEMEKWVKRYGQPDEIVSGGAVGADRMAERYAEKYGIPITVFKPDYERYPGKYAPIVRNTQIIEHCTHVLAFPYRQGRGTQDSMKKAKRFHRKMRIIWID